MTGGAIVGIGELAPQRYSTGSTTLSILAEASIRALQDSGLTPDAIDGLLVGPQVVETPQHVPATEAEYLGLRPSVANVVDLGGALAAAVAYGPVPANVVGVADMMLNDLGAVNEHGVARHSP